MRRSVGWSFAKDIILPLFHCSFPSTGAGCSVDKGKWGVAPQPPLWLCSFLPPRSSFDCWLHLSGAAQVFFSYGTCFVGDNLVPPPHFFSFHLRMSTFSCHHLRLLLLLFFFFILTITAGFKRMLTLFSGFLKKVIQRHGAEQLRGVGFGPEWSLFKMVIMLASSLHFGLMKLWGLKWCLGAKELVFQIAKLFL